MAPERKFPLVSEVELPEDNPLAKMYRLFNPDIPESRKLSYAVFAEFDREYDMIAKFCLNRMAVVAGRYEAQYKNAIANRISVDAMVRVLTVGQANDAWAFIVPPVNGGKAVEATDILSALYEIKVTNGINYEDVQRAAQNHIYLKALHVASGQLAVAGENGSVTDRFQRVPKRFLFEEDEDGDVDFKNTGWLQSVRKGDIICDIKPATEGLPGINVFGERIPAKSGKMPVIPQGRNTSISPDGKSLVADIDGHLIFEDECFRVERNLVINGNIGAGTGNINTHGNVRITGDVPTGFSVKTSGNLTINGTVQGADVYAGGNLIIEKGVAGESMAKVEAGGFIRCGYIQDCTMKAGKDIKAESIVASDIRTEGAVKVTSGKGTIVGGRVSSRYGINARVFGNDSSKYTELDMSLPAEYIPRYKLLSGNLIDLEKKRVLALKHRDVIFKKAQLASRNGEPENKIRMILASENDGKNPSLEELSEQIDAIHEELYDLEKVMKLYEASEIRCVQANPNTMVIINGAKRQVKNFLERCIFKKGFEKVKLEKYDEENNIIETVEDDDHIIEIKEIVSEAELMTKADAGPVIPDKAADEPLEDHPAESSSESSADDVTRMYASSDSEVNEMDYFAGMFASEPSSIF